MGEWKKGKCTILVRKWWDNDPAHFTKKRINAMMRGSWAIHARIQDVTVPEYTVTFRPSMEAVFHFDTKKDAVGFVDYVIRRIPSVENETDPEKIKIRTKIFRAGKKKYNGF